MSDVQPARASRRRSALITLAALTLALSACGTSKNAAVSTPAPTTASPAAVQSSAQPTTTSAQTPSASNPAMDPSMTMVTESSEPAEASPAGSAAGSPAESSPAESPDRSAVESPAREIVPAAVPKAPIDNAITIETPGMRYNISGKLRPGVASITLKNTDDEAHMMAIARLKKGVTLDQVKKALGQSEDAAAPLLADGMETGYGTPDLLGAGQSETVTAVDLPAGSYALICFLTDAKGMPHWQMGMVDLLTVAGTTATEKPKADGTITLDDKAITLPKGFTGSGTFLVRNTGKAPHNISIARLDGDTPLLAYYGHVGQAMNGQGQIEGGGGSLVGGIDVLAPGQSAYLTLGLAKGHYAYLSTTDAQGPELPVQHGEFEVS